MQRFGEAINRQTRAPPSNQQRISNEDILGPRPMSVASGYTPAPEGQARGRLSSVAEKDAAEEDEEDEDDDFQEDDRQIDAQISAAISRNLQNSRARASSSSMPPPPRPSGRAPAASDGASSHFQALKEEKRMLAQQARALGTSRGAASSQGAGATITTNLTKQRHPWSDHDCQVLLELINTRQAGWSIMETSDKDRFEHPRNQQAYRDKARNMKVDYLMTNAVLPPNFNLVALGKKEIERLLSYGKNPYRREEDLDDEGNAINTEKRIVP